jgi:Holliday junction DNA helicase RuvA
MIARLEGVLRDKTPTRVLIDVGGVGYEVSIPLSTYAALPDEGKTVALRIHTHVREDAMLLFGFHTARERAAFELLIRTRGVGPRLAQTILSGISPDDLGRAVRAGDVLALCAVPGVGAKTAERLVVDLRDRVAELAGPPESDAAPRSAAGDPRVEQAVSALVNLGIPESRADRVVGEALAALGEDAPVESLIRAALRGLSR